MKLYAAFLKDMDSDGKGSSAQFSEIDLSDPEDVKALVPDGNSEVLVHFGTENFLARYRKYGEHIAEWRTQYPRLSSVDMRYERQVVLQMPQKDSTVVNAAPVEVGAAANEKPKVTAPVAMAARRPATTGPVPSKPAVARASAATAKPAHTPMGAEAKEAATRKRVEAIKAWMAKREKSRAAAAAHSGSAASGQAN